MNASFKDIIPRVIRREGGFVHHPNDEGGATNMGVTLECMRRHEIDIDGDGDVDVDDVKALPFKRAIKLYLDQYWKPSKANRLPAQLREFYFDMTVNHGISNAVAILQKAAVKEGKEIAIDGIIGPNTLEAVKYLELRPLVTERIYFYSLIRHKNSSQKVFYDGWLERCFEFIN